MKALLLMAGAFFASVAFAAKVAAPLPPPSPYADTESVTNVAFNAGVAEERCKAPLVLRLR